ncbi:MAG: sigma-70 family RNA polymerase sigma factor [Planctomycetales bacterium]|nr:sigma-70 family RNA polymerase sigma factor [Planctomycetales bacterium]
MTAESLANLIARARTGDSEALGRLLEQHRPFLRLLAARQLDDRTAVRVDASDLVQLTFLEAQRDFSQFHGDREEQLLAWLKTMLRNNLGEVIQQHVRAEKRSTNREQPLETPPGSQRQAEWEFAAEQSSPSQRVMRGEAAVRLAQAIENLAEPQREAIRLRYLEGYTLKQLAERMERSETAVAGLLKRGLQGLRSYFAEL